MHLFPYLDVCILLAVSWLFVYLHLQIPMLIKSVDIRNTTTYQVIYVHVTQASSVSKIPVTNSTLTVNASTVLQTAVTTQVTMATPHSKCTYNKDITVYMDAFKEVSQYYFKKEYQEFLDKSHQCDPLPGGGHCSFNHDDSSSDAIFYYGGVTKLNYTRVFDDQIVVVFTQESEKGENCHFPPPDRYDIKVSYRRDSTIPLPFMCEKNLALRLAEMGQPEVPVGRENLVAGIISNCHFEWRVNYTTELMKHIHVDQWGKCLRNTPGRFWRTRRRAFEEEKLKLLNKNPYKFLIAFENAVEDDYITEKIYHAYLTRSIPIFYGDKAVFDLVPANTSLIYANNYTPKQLAELIQRIANDDSLYSEYFKNWDLVKMRKLHERYCSEHFVCATCRKVWETLYKRKCNAN